MEFTTDHGDIDTPGEYFSHPRWYHALITTLQDNEHADLRVHAANDKESRLPARLLDVGTRKRRLAVISRGHASCRRAATRRCFAGGFRGRFFELNGHDPQSVRLLVDYLAALSEREEEAGEKLIVTIFVRPARRTGDVGSAARQHYYPGLAKWQVLHRLRFTECDELRPGITSAQACREAAFREAIIAQLPEGSSL